MLNWSDLKIKMAGDIFITVWDNDKYVGIALIPHMFCDGEIKKLFIELIKNRSVSVKVSNAKNYINEVVKRHFPDIYGSFCVSHANSSLTLSVVPVTEHESIDFEKTKIKFTRDNVHVSYHDGEYEFWFTNKWLIQKSKKYDSMLNKWIFDGEYPKRKCPVPHNVLSGLNKRIKRYTGAEYNAFGADKKHNIKFHPNVTIEDV